jgi:hypothetical protein
MISETITLTSFLELDDDILTLITSYLLDIRSFTDALSMSVLCKRLRKISLSLIFRDVHWPRHNRIDFYPPTLWPYIRCVFFEVVKV